MVLCWPHQFGEPDFGVYFSVAYSRSVWVVVMHVGMLRLDYRGVGAGTVAPWVSGRDIVLATSYWRTGPWFLVVVAWSHIVWVV